MGKGLVVVMAILAAAAPAMAGFSSGTLVTEYSNGTGTHWLIDGTGYLLFEPTSPYNPSGPGSGVWDNNNMSPVDFPNVSPPYVPSPGSKGYYEFAEHTDIEGMFYKYDCDTGNLKVWVVTSIAPNGFYYNSYPYHLGDVFVDTDDDAGYEYALLGFGTKPGLSANHSVNGDQIHSPWNSTNNRDAGELAILNGGSILYGINGPASWSGNSSVRALLNPWAVNNPSVLGGDNLVYQQISGQAVNERDFEGGPGVDYWPAGTHSTYIYFWNVVFPEYLWPDLCETDFDFHVTIQCGNDVLEGGTLVDGGGNKVPVPGAMALGLIGIGGLAAARKKIRL